MIKVTDSDDEDDEIEGTVVIMMEVMVIVMGKMKIMIKGR